MSGSQKETEELKDYADGWINERKGTDVPGFLKLAFAVIGLGCVAYLVLQMSGDIHNADRGKFVEQFNRVSHTSPAMSYAIAAIALVYVITVVAFAIRKFED